MDALLSRIVVLCKGDRLRAKQLVNQTIHSHPGQSTLWHLQKAIADLEQEQAEQFRQKKIAPATVTTAGRSLRQILTQSRRDNPDRSEAWHLQKAQSSQSSQTSGLVNSHQWQRLLSLLQGDKAAANRLINNMRQRHPGKPDQWVLEKVLQDLERDRS